MSTPLACLSTAFGRLTPRCYSGYGFNNISFVCNELIIPLSAVDNQHLIPPISLDPPNTSHAHKRLWLRANAFIGKVDFEGLCCGSKQQRREAVSGCHCKSSNVFADYHSWPPFFLTKCAGMCGARRLHHHATAINNGRATKNQGNAIHPSATRGYPGYSSPDCGVGTGMPANP